MGKQHAPRATLFLMELVVVILFFSICAAICVNVFGTAQTMARDSDNLSKAVIEVRSAASCYKAAAGDLQETAALLGGTVSGNMVAVYYDNTWQETTQPTNGGFAVQIVQRGKAGEASVQALEVAEDAAAQIGKLTAQDEIIFSVSVKTHGEAAR